MPRRFALLVLLLPGIPARVDAQVPVRAPGGTLVGVVRDSMTLLPVGYALVALGGSDQRTFTGESGRFTLTGLGAGPATIRVRQIGFRARTVSIRVDPGRASSSEPGLVIDLVRLALVLPEVPVEGNTCAGLEEVGSASADGILGQAFANAERILTLERKYPFVLTYQRMVQLLDSNYERISGRIDTLRKDSRAYVAYRAGRVLERAGTAGERVNAFTSSDIAGEDFQKSHCFWYAGRDSVEGFPGYRIDFAPRPSVTTADWAGSILIDSASMVLLRTEARLVNIPASGTYFLSALCTLYYQPIVPSLPQEFQTKCVSSQKHDSPHYRVERWLLVDRRFRSKTPIDRGPPP